MDDCQAIPQSSLHRTAGGVVLDAAGQMLALVRDIEREGAVRHEVRLPKGHIEAGETDEEAALREVCEESGCCAVDVVADLGTMTSEYEFLGIHRVRTEHYYLMRIREGGLRAPAPAGAEEALFEVRWLPREQAPAAMTYPSEQEFARRAVTAWNALNPTAEP